ncbi:MAG: hypothetical protein LH474_05370 [Chamaesiphon sp.]|nr:hypothetical protein [Chamaesiphon sp.]
MSSVAALGVDVGMRRFALNFSFDSPGERLLLGQTLRYRQRVCGTIDRVEGFGFDLRRRRYLNEFLL